MTIANRESATVYTRAEWGDAWVERPHLEPIQVRDCLAPQMPYASLHYRYGEISSQGQDAFYPVEPLNIEWHFIKIAWTGQSGTSLRWYGVITDIQYNVMPVAAADPKAGDQVFRAQGLPCLLDMFPLYFAKGANIEDNDQNAPLTIGWAPAFNLRDQSTQLMGNGYHWGSNVVQFGAPNWPPTYQWSYREIIEYLLREFCATGTIWGPTWTLVDDDAADDLDNLVDVVEQEGRTIRQVLNMMIRPQRGYAWYVSVPANESGIQIRIIPVSPSAIATGGATLHANPNQETWVFADDQDIAGRPQITRALSARYDYVAVLGHRVITCFSLSKRDATLIYGWSGIEQQAYTDAASGATGYADMSIDQQRELNDLWRSKDGTVFSYYAVPNLWTWQAGDGAGGTKHPAQPLVVSGGSGIEPAFSDDYMIGRGWYQFLSWLPLREGVDYTNEHFPVGSTGGEHGFLKPLAFVKDLGTAHYCYADKPEIEHVPSAVVRPDEKELGMHVHFSPPHVLATIDLQGSGYVTNMPRSFHSDDLVLTVAVETDHRIKVIEAAPDAGLSTGYRVMALYMDSAHLWYLLPGTVVGIDANGALQRVATGATKEQRILRDDTGEMAYIAKLTAAWYGRDRAAIAVTYRKLDQVKALGVLITTVDCGGGHTLQANTVVSEVTWDFSRGQGTTQYMTDFYELDVSGLSRANQPRWLRMALEHVVDRQRQAPEPSIG